MNRSAAPTAQPAAARSRQHLHHPKPALPFLSLPLIPTSPCYLIAHYWLFSSIPSTRPSHLPTQATAGPHRAHAGPCLLRGCALWTCHHSPSRYHPKQGVTTRRVSGSSRCTPSWVSPQARYATRGDRPKEGAPEGGHTLRADGCNPSRCDTPKLVHPKDTATLRWVSLRGQCHFHTGAPQTGCTISRVSP